jgi:RHS repeat-associated protein
VGAAEGQIKFRNVGPTTLSFGGRSLASGELGLFDGICDYVQFIHGSGAKLHEPPGGGLVDALNRASENLNCGVTVEGVPAPDAAPSGDESELKPGEMDSATRLGAPEPATNGEMEAWRPPADQDTRSPAQQLNDGAAPRSEGEIADNAIDAGATGDEAADTLDRAKKGRPPKGEPDGVHGGERSQATPIGGDPVDLLSGAFVHSSVDLQVGSPFFPLAFERTYRSGFPNWGPFGFNWDHNWNIYLRPLSDGGVSRWNGQLSEDLFTPIDGVFFEPPRGIFERLSRVAADTFEIGARGGLSLRFERPAGWGDVERVPLVAIRDRFNNVVNLDYDERDRLATVLDDDGRGFSLAYGLCGLLEGVRDHTGRSVRYIHDDDATHLVRAVGPDAEDAYASEEYEYSWSADHPALRHNIVRVLDGTGTVLVWNKFGDDPAQWTWNRVVEQYQGPFPWYFDYSQLQWLASIDAHVNEPMWRTEVIEPDGTLRVYAFNFRGDLLDERFRLSRDSSYRIVSSQRRYDEQGNLIERRNGDSVATKWTFDHQHADPRLRGTLLEVELRPPLGVPALSRRIMRVRYGTPFQLPVEETNEAGARTVFNYRPGDGALERIDWPTLTDPDGTTHQISTLFEVDTRGLVQTTTSPGGIRDEISYLAGGPTAGFPEVSRHDTTGAAEVRFLTWTPEGWLRSVTDAVGATVTIDRDHQGRTKSVTLPEVDGRRVRWDYERGAAGQVIAVHRPAGAAEGVAGDRIVDVIARNPIGQPKSMTVGSNLSAAATFTYCLDHRGNVVEEVDPLGVVTSRRFDERGLLLAEAIAAPGSPPLTDNYLYDRTGQQVRLDLKGDQTRQEFDLWDRLARIMGADGTTVELTYGQNDHVVASTVVGDPGDGSAHRVLRRTEVELDEHNRPIRSRLRVFTDDVAHASILQAVTWFDHDGRPVRHIGPTGGVTLSERDGLGRLIRITDAAGNVVSWDYGQANSSVTVSATEVGAGAPVTSWVRRSYDPRGRCITALTSADSRWRWRYDDRDQVIAATDPVGTVSTLVHDLWGNVVERTTDSLGRAQVEAYERDVLGRIVGYLDPVLSHSSIGRDELGRDIRVAIGEAFASHRSFDSNGRLKRQRHSDGTEINYERGPGGRVRSIWVHPGAGVPAIDAIHYRYDGLGRKVEARQGADAIIWRYDSLNRIVAEDGPLGSFTRAYDDAAQTVTTTWPTGRTERATWDDLGRVHAIDLTAPDGSLVDGQAGDPLLRLDFQGMSRISSLRLGNGASTEQRHDEAGRVAELRIVAVDGAEAVTRYAYDRAGRRILDSQNTSPQRSRRFTLRPSGELESIGTGTLNVEVAAVTQADQDQVLADASAAPVDLTVSYDLDDAGVRRAIITRAGNAPQTTTLLARGPAYRLDAFEGAPVDHDESGRRTGDAQRTIVYDALGRVQSVTAAGGQVVAFKYDPAGRIAERATNGAPVRFGYLGGLLLAECDQAGRPVRHFTRHPGMVAAVAETGAQGFVGCHVDQHADLVATTGATGRLIDRYLYEPFGQASIIDPATGLTRPAPASGVQASFGGMEQIGGVDLYWTPTRLYDPRAGLFCAIDPCGLADAADPFVYCGHSPLDHLDPEGEVVPLIVIGVMAGIGAILGGGAAWWSGGDGWDIAAGALIGGVAGGLGGWLFSAAAAGGATAIGGWLAETALAGTTLGSWIASAGGSALGGLVSGTAAGGFSGGANGAWRGYRDVGEIGAIGAAAWAGFKRESAAGGVSGVLTGGLFGGLMRVGALPAAIARPGVVASGGLTAFTDTAVAAGQQVSRRAAMMPGVVARGLVSPWGVAGAAGTGFVGGYSAQVTRDIYEGRDVDDAFLDSWDEGLEGTALGLVGQAFHPVTYRYWKVRLDVRQLTDIKERRVGRVKLHGTTAHHHQLNNAQYPEFAFPVPRQGESQDWRLRLANEFSRENVSGRYSDFGSRAQHVAWHEMWRTSDIPSWMPFNRVPTHGPFKPAWNPYLPPVQGDPNGSDAPEKTVQ